MDKSSLAAIAQLYGLFAARHNAARRLLGRPLTLAEKIFLSHLAGEIVKAPRRGIDYLSLYPDRVAMQDATAQMAILQFMVTARASVAVPTTVHCDHLIQARSGAGEDLQRALDENREVYAFLRSACARHDIGFWEPGAGIIHQVVLEQYAFPGGLMIGTDSHTPNAGGLGMVAIGVGGADAVDVMAAQPWSILCPKLLGVRLSGRLSGWASPKDVILKVAGMLTVKGGTGRILEYFGPGTSSISCTGKATITNMGAELGATTSIFPYDGKMGAYLRQTGRSEVADLADRHSADLCADAEVLSAPEKFFDELIEIDLSALEPHWVGPHTPDLLRPVSAMRQAAAQEGYPDRISRALIGSCTNSSYEDISRAASIARQARERGLKVQTPLLVTPGSDQIFRTIERDGFVRLFEEVGATVLANACGPCIGQWQRDDVRPGERNTIITSYNRNFRKRNDGNSDTMAFIGSPELVTAVAFTGSLSFNPVVEEFRDATGKMFRFSAPQGEELPSAGYVFSRKGFVAAPASEELRKAVRVEISPSSQRLAFLESFGPWDGQDMLDLLVLLKAKGKCTTDHISQAGPWLKFRGHLSNISDNMFLGALNAFDGSTGTGLNVLSGERGRTFPEIAKDYKAQKRGWLVVGDENYGEGSSREHAAMSPRFLGCRAVIARSFARIHETNLKKQGILPLTFVDPADYDLIGETDLISITGLQNLRPGSEVVLKVKSAAGERSIKAAHSMTGEQIGWLRAGSALNVLRPA